MLLGLGVLLVLSAIGLRHVVKDVPFTLDAAEIQHEGGLLYRAPMKRRLSWPWQPISDHQYSPRRSRLILLEDGRLIGHAHSDIDQIKTLGAGRYAHWVNALFFSSSDRTDPRANKRRYHGTLSAGVAPRLVQQLNEIGSAMILSALGALLWLRRRRLSQLLRALLSRWRGRLPDYLLALAGPALVSLWELVSLPLMWNGSDSSIWLLWQWHWIPHHPPIYPAFMALANALFDTPESVVRFVATAQHAATVLAIAYLATAFRGRWQILWMSLVGTFAVAGGVYAQGLFTEGLASAFFLFFLGAVLRLYRDGTTRPVLAALGLGLLAASLTRHAYIFFALVPVAYLVIVQLFTRALPVRERLRTLSVVFALVGGVALANSLVVQYACLMLDSQCTSIIGRAGVYRMQDAYALVPGDEREGWLAGLVERAPDRFVAEAIPLMVTAPNPWTGPRDAIALDSALSGQGEDRLMNAGFMRFLTWPDRYVLRQWWRQLGQALLGPGGQGYCAGHPSCVLQGSARSVEEEFPADPRSVAAVVGTGAEEPGTGARYRELERQDLVRVLDRLLPLAPEPRAAFLALSLLLGLAAMLRQRNLDFAAVVLALWSGALAYALALTLVTVVLPRYVLPIDNVLWLANGLAIIGLLARRDPRGVAAR